MSQANQLNKPPAIISTHAQRETDIAAKLYDEFVGYDLANRPPLRCQTIYMQRQWLAVARLAIALVPAGAADPSITDLERVHVVRVGFTMPPIEIPRVPLPAGRE